jgi:hypothetical protein
VGAAAFAVQFAIARELLSAGVGIILEGPFFSDQSELVDVAKLGAAVVLRLESPLAELERRYIDRQGERHPSHRGLEALPDLRRRVRDGAYDPPEMGCALLRVDTSHGLSPSEDEIENWVRGHLSNIRAPAV